MRVFGLLRMSYAAQGAGEGRGGVTTSHVPSCCCLGQPTNLDAGKSMLCVRDFPSGDGLLVGMVLEHELSVCRGWGRVRWVGGVE